MKRMDPPSFARILERTSRSAIRCFHASSQPAVSPRRCSALYWRPTPKPQPNTAPLTPVSASVVAVAFAWIFSSTRGTAASMVGRTIGSTSPRRGMWDR